MADLLPRMVQMLDEPIGDAAAINTYLICRAARQAGVKVLLSGMGADELFGGYRKHYAGLLAARYRRLPGVLRHRVVAPAVERLPVAGRRRGYRVARGAKRFVAFADLHPQAPAHDLGGARCLQRCPRRRRSAAATPTTTSASCTSCSTPSSGRGSTSWSRSTRPSTTRARPTTR